MRSVTTAPPAPRDLPAVGGRFRPVLAMRRNMIRYVEDMQHAHGDAVRTVIGPPGMDREVWLLSHPDAAARVLSGSTWRSFAKRDPVYGELRTWFGRGLLSAEGEEWAHQKRFLQPAFTRAAVEGYGDLMVDEIARVLAERDSAGPGVVVDLGPWTQQLAMRVLCRALFGESADAVLGHVQRTFPVLSETVVRRAVGALRVPASVPTPVVRRGRVARAELFDAAGALVAARRQHGRPGSDLLGRLLAAQESGEGLTDVEVRDQVITFLIAGQETTATALTFTLHLLGRRPELQEAVRAEVRQVVGDGRPTVAVTSSLHLTTAVLEEAMRLYAPVPFVSRMAVVDDEVLGRPIRAGAIVVVIPWNIHRHPDVWADPLRFDPSRFLDAGAAAHRHRYAWMPFGGGPRACIGQHFSLVEATLTLALLLRDHRVTSLAPGDAVPVDALVTLFPTVPVRARVERLR